MIFEGAARVFACSQDGGILVTADADAIRIFDIATGRRRHQVGLGEVEALAINADGSRIAAKFRDPQSVSRETSPTPISSIVVIETATGHPVTKMQSVADAALHQLAFSANGRSLAAAGGVDSGMVQVWSTATTDTNLRAKRLQLTEPELDFLAQLWPLVRTPRAAKRLINVYRLLRAPLGSAELANLLGNANTEAEYPAALLLLTIVTGFPDLAPAVIGELRQGPAGTWADFISNHRPSAGKTISSGSPLLWTIFFERYDLVDQAKLPAQIDSYVRWAPMVARYSFRTGRLLN